MLYDPPCTGEGSVSWNNEGSFTTQDGTFVVTMNQTLVQITNVVGDTVQFAVLRSQLNCTKYSVCPRKHYLGFYVPVTVGLSSKTHGMIGMDYVLSICVCLCMSGLAACLFIYLFLPYYKQK